jgi:HSP20 family protein
MAIQRWDPQRDLVQLQGHVNRMFEEVLGRSTSPDGGDRARPGDWRPPLDLFEEAGHFVLRADLPGVPPSDVEIRIEDNRLVLAGERKPEQQSYLRMERPFGRFSARVALPPSVDRNRIHANHRNGVLEIVLPKKREEGPSRIEVAGT